jgi:phosphatidylglycerol---prolipoprotein diacylglyceryl transferase
VNNSGSRKCPLSIALTIAVYITIFWIVLPAFLFSIGLRMDALLPIPWTASRLSHTIGGVLTGIGVTLAALSMKHLWTRGKGLPISHLPPQKFVSSGFYRVFRHPLYIGYTALFMGAAVLISSFWSLAFSAPLLICGWVGYALFYEEPVLLSRFGEAYAQYRKATPMFVPCRVGRAMARALDPWICRLFSWLSRLADFTIIFRRGNLIMVTYGLLVAIGSFVFMLHMSTLFLAQGVRVRDIVIFLVESTLSGAFFAHAFWWLKRWKEMVRQPLWGIRQVGFVSYGALFGLVVAAAAFARIFRYDGLMVLDVVFRGMFIAYALGRIGCLTYGCCWGKESAGHGIVYRNAEAKVNRLHGLSPVRRYPTPFYSALEGLVIFALVNILPVAQMSAGFPTVFVFLFYPAVRLFIESYRDRDCKIFHCLNEGHLGCAIMFCAGLVLLFTIRPAIGSATPSLPDLTAGARVLPLVPIVLVLAGAIFLISGFHWRRVGSW